MLGAHARREIGLKGRILIEVIKVKARSSRLEITGSVGGGGIRARTFFLIDGLALMSEAGKGHGLFLHGLDREFKAGGDVLRADDSSEEGVEDIILVGEICSHGETREVDEKAGRDGALGVTEIIIDRLSNEFLQLVGCEMSQMDQRFTPKKKDPISPKDLTTTLYEGDLHR